MIKSKLIFLIWLKFIIKLWREFSLRPKGFYTLPFFVLNLSFFLSLTTFPYRNQAFNLKFSIKSELQYLYYDNIPHPTSIKLRINALFWDVLAIILGFVDSTKFEHKFNGKTAK